MLKYKFYVWKYDKDRDGYNIDSGNWYPVDEIRHVQFGKKEDGIVVAVVRDHTDDRLFYCVHPSLTKSKLIRED